MAIKIRNVDLLTLARSDAPIPILGHVGIGIDANEIQDLELAVSRIDSAPSFHLALNVEGATTNTANYGGIAFTQGASTDTIMASIETVYTSTDGHVDLSFSTRSVSNALYIQADGNVSIENHLTIPNAKSYKVENSSGVGVGVVSLDSSNRLTLGSSNVGGVVWIKDGYADPSLSIQNQKVGIGTGTGALTAKLQVNNGWIQVSSTYGLTSSGTVAYISDQDNNGNLTDISHEFRSDGTTPILTMLKSGKVGIGTVNPKSLLTIGNTDDNDHIKLYTDTTSEDQQAEGTGIVWTWNNSTTLDNEWAAVRAIFPGAGNTHMTFSTQVNSTEGLKERVRISDNGNVGIGAGANTLSHPLEVWHGTPAINLKDTSSSGQFRFELDGVKATIKNHSTNGDLELLTTGTGDIVLSPAGNVGIGTGTGTINEKLEVKGGRIRIDNRSTTTSGTAELKFYSAYTNTATPPVEVGNSAKIIYKKATAGIDQFEFNLGGVTYPQVVFTNSGYVGINKGADAPSYELDVVGTTRTDNLRFRSDTATASNILDEDDMASDSPTALVTQQSIKAYVDTQLTAEDLDVSDGTTDISIDLDSEKLIIAGGTGLTSVAGTKTVTLSVNAAQTGITSVRNTDLVIGRDLHNDIDFATDNTIIFRVANADELKIVNGGFVPVTDNHMDLGAASYCSGGTGADQTACEADGGTWVPALAFKDLYLDGTADIDSLVADTADINGGTIDGTTIGATTASTGAFTSVDINGGTIDETTIGATTASTGAFTTLSASSTLEVTGIAKFADKVGIGTGATAPSANLQIHSDSPGNGARMLDVSTNNGNIFSVVNYHDNYGHCYLRSTGDMYLGTDADIDTVRIGSGTVGIGTGATAPAEKLDIEGGNIRVHNNGGYLLLEATGDTAYNTKLVNNYDNSNTFYLSTYYGKVLEHLNNSAYGSKHTYLLGDDQPQLSLRTNSDDRVFIDENGNVGIGTGPSIDTILHVQAASPVLKVEATGTNSHSVLNLNPLGTGTAKIQFAGSDMIAIDSSNYVKIVNGELFLGTSGLYDANGDATSSNSLPETGTDNVFHHLLMLEDETGRLKRTDTVAQVVVEDPKDHNPSNTGGEEQVRATASAIVRSDGKIIGIRVIKGGSGYGNSTSNRPWVKIRGGGGAGATAFISSDSTAMDGRTVVSITVNAQGSGYHSVGMIKPEAALEIADILETNKGNWESTGAATITSSLTLPYGVGYTEAPILTIGDNWAASTTYAVGDLIAAANGILYKVTTAGGTPTSGLTAPAGIVKGDDEADADSNSTLRYTCMGPRATAVAIIQDGKVTQLAIVQCGDGYDASNPPTVTVDDSNSGCTTCLGQTVSVTVGYNMTCGFNMDLDDNFLDANKEIIIGRGTKIPQLRVSTKGLIVGFAEKDNIGGGAGGAGAGVDIINVYTHDNLYLDNQKIAFGPSYNDTYQLNTSTSTLHLYAAVDDFAEEIVDTSRASIEFTSGGILDPETTTSFQAQGYLHIGTSQSLLGSIKTVISVTHGSNKITLSANHNIDTGESVYLSGVTLPAGITSEQVYFARVSGSDIYLHTTRAGALNNTGIVTITSAGSGFRFYSLIDAVVTKSSGDGYTLAPTIKITKPKWRPIEWTSTQPIVDGHRWKKDDFASWDHGSLDIRAYKCKANTSSQANPEANTTDWEFSHYVTFQTYGRVATAVAELGTASGETDKVAYISVTDIGDGYYPDDRVALLGTKGDIVSRSGVPIATMASALRSEKYEDLHYRADDIISTADNGTSPGFTLAGNTLKLKIADDEDSQDLSSIIPDTVTTIDSGDLDDLDHFLTFVDNNNSASASELLYTNAGIKFNPKTDKLTLGDASMGSLTIDGSLTVKTDTDSSLSITDGGSNYINLFAAAGDVLQLGGNNTWGLKVGLGTNGYDAQFRNKLDVDGTLNVDGETTLGGALDLNSTADISDTLTLSKAAGTGLSVTKDATIGGSLDVGGLIEVGPDASAGGIFLQQDYSGDDIINSFSSQYSEATLVLGYGARGGENSTEGGGKFWSTFDNFAGHRSALSMKGDQLKFSATPAAIAITSHDVDDELTTMADVFTVSNSGDGVFEGTLGVTGDATLGGKLDAAGDATLGGKLDAAGDATLGGTLGVAGDATLSGKLYIESSNSTISAPTAGDYISFSTTSTAVGNASKYLQAGVYGGGYMHFNTDEAKYYFNKPVYVNGDLYKYGSNNTSKRVLTTEDYGGDSDTVDGYHATGLLELFKKSTATNLTNSIELKIGGTTKYVDIGAFSIGTAEKADKIDINSASANAAYRLTMVDAAGTSYEQLYTDNDSLTFNPSSNQLSIGKLSASNISCNLDVPTYSHTCVGLVGYTKSGTIADKSTFREIDKSHMRGFLGYGSAADLNATVASSVWQITVLNASNAASATKAANLTGGSKGNLLYQNAVNDTAFLAGNTTSTRKFLMSKSASATAVGLSYDDLESADIPDNGANTTGKASTAGVADSITNQANSATTTCGTAATASQIVQRDASKHINVGIVKTTHGITMTAANTSTSNLSELKLKGDLHADVIYPYTDPGNNVYNPKGGQLGDHVYNRRPYVPGSQVGHLTEGAYEFVRGRTVHYQYAKDNSDERIKNEIESMNLGLDFIEKLRPVTFKFTNTDSPRKHYGIIAQELKQALEEAGETDQGIISIDGYHDMPEDKREDGLMSVGPNEVMWVMVKAVQELSEKVKQLEKKLEEK